VRPQIAQLPRDQVHNLHAGHTHKAAGPFISAQ
jgi:hypothetical protein